MLYQQLITELGHSQTKSFKRGEIIYNEGDFPESLFAIESGIIGLFHISESGQETLLRVFTKGHIFGHRSLIAGENYHASSVSLTPSKVYAIPYSKLKEICAKNTEVIFSISKILAKELRAQELRMSGLQDKSTNRRIIEAMVFLKLKHPNYTWTRKEIAEFAQAAVESVVRVITSLEKEGLLEKVGRDFLIKDFEALLDYSKDI